MSLDELLLSTEHERFTFPSANDDKLNDGLVQDELNTDLAKNKLINDLEWKRYIRLCQEIGEFVQTVIIRGTKFHAKMLDFYNCVLKYLTNVRNFFLFNGEHHFISFASPSCDWWRNGITNGYILPLLDIYYPDSNRFKYVH